MLRSSGSTPGMAHITALRRVLYPPSTEEPAMYYLYAEDTSDKSFRCMRPLQSKRFSRAMREAEKEPTMIGCRLFIAEPTQGYMSDTPNMSTAAYLGVSRKPAPIGSPANQAHQRQALRNQKQPSRGAVDWDSKNEQGETLGEIYVDMIRRDVQRGS
jgi:hypothetical protein